MGESSTLAERLAHGPHGGSCQQQLHHQTHASGTQLAQMTTRHEMQTRLPKRQNHAQWVPAAQQRSTAPRSTWQQRRSLQGQAPGGQLAGLNAPPAATGQVTCPPSLAASSTAASLEPVPEDCHPTRGVPCGHDTPANSSGYRRAFQRANPPARCSHARMA